jgi:hypothetical protein
MKPSNVALQPSQKTTTAMKEMNHESTALVVSLPLHRSRVINSAFTNRHKWTQRPIR